MIVIKMEIWPNGSRQHRVELGALTLININPDDLATANYDVRLYRSDRTRDLDAVVKEARGADVQCIGLVTGFKRLKRNAWSLLFLAIASLRPSERDGDDLNFGFGQPH
jgi:hypothetical protein